MAKIQDLAAVLAERHLLTGKAAEKFIEDFFSVLNDGLHYEKQVKVKGLGTFKVSSVAPRESIDVNTGKRILIEARDKISFTPEASMRDLVNKPFAQFETVVVNDGVDFEQIDAKFSQDEDGAVAEVLGQTKEQYEKSKKHEERVEEASEPSPSPDAPSSFCLTSEELSLLNGTAGQDDGSLAGSESDEKLSPPSPVLRLDNDMLKELNGCEPQEEVALPEEEETHEEELEVNGDVDDGEQLDKSRRMTRILLGAAVFCLLAFVACGFYVGHQLRVKDNRIAYLESRLVAGVPQKSTQAGGAGKQSMTVPSQSGASSASKVVSTDDNVGSGEEQKERLPAKNAGKDEASLRHSSDDKNETKTQKEDKANVSGFDGSVYNKDARVRTGAYIIIGIEQTVTVKKGQTLASISRVHLGPGMECYVEAVNNGTKEVKAGQKINIPKLKHK